MVVTKSVEKKFKTEVMELTRRLVLAYKEYIQTVDYSLFPSAFKYVDSDRGRCNEMLRYTLLTAFDVKTHRVRDDAEYVCMSTQIINKFKGIIGNKADTWSEDYKCAVTQVALNALNAMLANMR